MKLIVVAPFFNEEENIPNFYRELKDVLDNLPHRHEMIFVDDGSTDGTLEELKKLTILDQNLSVLSLSRNFGHQMALTAGLDHANGDAVIVMDSDLQHPPDLIPAMLELFQNGADIVYAVRENDQGLGIVKRITSRSFYRILGRMTNLKFIPGSADFRLMRWEVVEALQSMRETHRFLRGMVPWTGWNATSLSYHQPERRAGMPSYTWRKSLRLARHGLFSFSTVPLEIITWLGLGLAVLGGIYLAYILIITLVGIAVQGWTSTISAILILGGVQLLSLGIVAQYIGMIFEEVKDRPLYLLKYKDISSQRKEPRNQDD